MGELADLIFSDEFQKRKRMMAVANIMKKIPTEEIDKMIDHAEKNMQGMISDTDDREAYEQWLDLLYGLKTPMPKEMVESMRNLVRNIDNLDTESINVLKSINTWLQSEYKKMPIPPLKK